jgi:hypothetical protein
MFAMAFLNKQLSTTESKLMFKAFTRRLDYQV